MLRIMSDPKVQEILVNLLLAIVQLLIVGVGTVAVQWIRSKLSARQLELGLSIAHIAVAASEQLAASMQIDLHQKYAYALEMARDQAAKFGLQFTDDQWETLIESAVKEMKYLGAELKQPFADEEEDDV